MADQILTASTVITLDDATPRAEAVAVSGDRITAVGSLADLREAFPSATVVDTGAAALLPGFVEPHGHPLVSGLATEPLVRSIAPWDAPTWADVEAAFAEALASTDPSVPLWFAGFDSLLHRHHKPEATELDRIFGDRIAVVTDNSGHAVYFNTAVIKSHGWDVNVPQDPVAGSFGRNADGTLNGHGFETPVLLAVTQPLLDKLGNPLTSAAEFYARMSRAGYTSATDMTYDPAYQQAYEALASVPSSPLRIAMWEVSLTDSYPYPTTFALGEEWLAKIGVKLWTDGSPWVGNIATSFPYLSTPATRVAGIDPAVAGGARSLNYTRDQLDDILDRAAPHGWSMSFHANGDLAIDLALDAYEDALRRHNLLGADHRWRLEHLGAGRREHFERAASLGVHVSLAPFQYYYWGDLLDGQMFDSEIGSQWQRFADAVASGAVVSLHNDGGVSPPSPVINVQTAVTRRTRSRRVHGANQTIGLDVALRAQTINAARTSRRDHLVGSISAGKLADFVELTADPYTVDPADLAEAVQVTGTWVGGGRVDLDQFIDAVSRADNSEHAHLSGKRQPCCR
ncbi:amidohydrolase [Mycobacterium shigaense]|uniref:Uncharacterized protein n=1 Tax=Mycobacterium shigaense TaxID=722731 RepID=A0A1Z4EFN6_9MYCO|nr:amidohydrolase family protein [Mycobacterium shigaense]MEA1124801.1 amidohydrolase family protein [Mycobacterium shigaense]PRI16483.1 amidohydrolase [Mycobacterium shigaense]BAX91758.1 hypothetical protein MSG_01604 [Mycobacterium shigaense]